MSAVEIRVYPNQLNREEYELLGCSAGITLHEYLVANVPAYRERPVPLFSVLINEKELNYNAWKTEQFEEGDLVEIIIEPKATATIIMAVIAVASAAYAIYTANKPLPDTYNSTTPKGSPIYDVNAQGNRPRLMGTAPFLFGRHKVYPDYLLPPRIEYIDNKQYYYAFLSVAVGEISLSTDDIYIGDTNITSLGSDIAVTIYEPGDDVSADESSKILYSNIEVGATGAETGLELTGAMAEESNMPWICQNNNFKEIAYSDSGSFQGGNYYQLSNDWTDEFTDNNGTETLVGKIIIFSNAGANNGYYRIKTAPTSGSGSGALSEWQKLTGDIDNLTDDLTWTGFTGTAVTDDVDTDEYIIFDADYRIIDLVERKAGYFGPYIAVPAGGSTELLYLDFRFNNGLCYLNNNGTPQWRSVSIEIQWREVGGTWSTIDKTYKYATLDQLAFTEQIAVPAGTTPEVRVRRITSEFDDIQYKDKIEWVGLRSSQFTKSSYPEFTTMSVRIIGNDAVSSSSNNKIGCVATAILKAMDDNGNVIPEEPTRDISAAMMKIADDLGYEIDLDALGVLHKKWIDRGDMFDAVFDNATTAWKAIQQVLAVGFTEPTLDFGKIIPIRDEPRTVLNYQYQADNILPNTWKMSGSFVDDNDHDGVEVEYMSDESWTSETVLCLLPGDLGENPEKIRAYGVTSRAKAYQFGMRQRATQKFRRVQHSFSTEMDALNSRYMSYDALGIDMPGYSQTGRLENLENRTLYLNQYLEWGDLATTHYIALRRPDGTLSGPYVCTPGLDDDSVELATDLDFVPVFNGNHEPPYFMFGKADEWCIPVLVTEIKPSGTDKVKVTAFEYSDDVYLYDDAIPADE